MYRKKIITIVFIKSWYVVKYVQALQSYVLVEYYKVKKEEVIRSW